MRLVARSGVRGLVVGLRRYSRADLHDCAELGGADIDLVLSVTGGWPSLVRRVINLRQKAGSVAAALTGIGRDLGTREFCAKLLDEVGLGGELVDVYRAATEVLDPGDVGQEELARFLEEERSMAGPKVALLAEMQVLDMDARGTVRPEAVVEAAWRQAG